MVPRGQIKEHCFLEKTTAGPFVNVVSLLEATSVTPPWPGLIRGLGRGLCIPAHGFMGFWFLTQIVLTGLSCWGQVIATGLLPVFVLLCHFDFSFLKAVSGNPGCPLCLPSTG